MAVERGHRGWMEAVVKPTREGSDGGGPEVEEEQGLWD